MKLYKNKKIMKNKKQIKKSFYDDFKDEVLTQKELSETLGGIEADDLEIKTIEVSEKAILEIHMLK